MSIQRGFTLIELIIDRYFGRISRNGSAKIYQFSG